MSIDKKYVNQFINVTSKAAIASSFLVGKRNKIAADKAALQETFKKKFSNLFSKLIN